MTEPPEISVARDVIATREQMAGTPADILRRAADRIEVGWCQHVVADGDPNDPATFDTCRVSAVGALTWATSGPRRQPWEPDRTSYTFDDAVHRLAMFVRQNLVSWNDTPGLTAAVVTATMRHVARIVDGEDQP